jgi:hypothetical protein
LAFDRQRKITAEDIPDLHRRMMTGVIKSAGKYRQDDAFVPEAGFSPSPWYEISSQIKELM